MQKCILVVACLILTLRISIGATFYVNSKMDYQDNALGDHKCETLAGYCTLRAAINESNACAGADTIIVSATAGIDTITTTGNYSITEELYLDGGNVVIDGKNLSGQDLFNVTGQNVKIYNLQLVHVFLTGLRIYRANNFEFIHGSITGRGVDIGSALIELFQSLNCRIAYSDFIKGGLSVRYIQSHYGIYEYCFADSNNHSNGTVYDSHGCIFRNNYARGSKDFNMFCIKGGYDNLFENNTLVGAGIAGIVFGSQSEVDSSNVRNNIVRNNLFIDNAQSAIDIHDFVNNITIEGNQMIRNGNGIRTSYETFQIRIVSNVIYNSSNGIILMNVDTAIVESNIIGNLTESGMFLQTSRNLSIHNNFIGVNDSLMPRPIGMSGINFSQIQNITITQNRIENAGNFGIANTDKYSNTRSSHVVIEGTSVLLSSWSAIDLGCIDTLTITNCFIDSSAQDAVRFSSMNCFSCLNTTIKNSGQNGIVNIDSYDGTFSTGVSISQTVILENSQIAIWLSSIDTVSITDCRIENNGGGVLFQKCNRVLLVNDTIRNNLQGGITNMDSNYGNSHEVFLQGVLAVNNYGSAGLWLQFLDSVAITGSTFSGNTGDGAKIENVASLLVQNTAFGIDATRVSAVCNGGNGLTLSGILTRIILGGGSSYRNYFASDTDQTSLVINASSGSFISQSGDFVGLNQHGDVVGNGTGERFDGDLSQTVVDGVAVAGSLEVGVLITGNGLRMYRSTIGTDTTGAVQSNYQNEYGMVILGHDAIGNQIGGVDTSTMNIVAGNNTMGIGIIGDTVDGFPSGNSVFMNRFWDNNGNPIDVIDFTDTTTLGPNEEFLEITYADAGIVIYNLDVPPGYHRVDFYVNTSQSPTGHGEGKQWIGYDTVLSSGVPIAGRIAMIQVMISGSFVSAVATECLIGCEIPGTSSEFSNSFLVQGGASLPVEMISFTASVLESSYVKLECITATEINNMGFVVMRSVDGVVFDSIGWMPGAGNSSIETRYVFNDTNPVQGISYYRLCQRDFNGTSKLSDVRAVLIDKFNSEPMLVYDINGRIVKHTTLEELENNVGYDRLPAGVYFTRKKRIFVK